MEEDGRLVFFSGLKSAWDLHPFTTLSYLQVRKK
jgi:hypothetical protein